MTGPERYTLLASAVAGRSLRVRAGSDQPAHTDGQMILLPDAPLAARTVTIQAALLAAGSFRPESLRALMKQPGVTKRYLTLEAARAVTVLEGFVPPGVVATVLAAAPAAVSDSPATSLRRALGTEAIADPPAWFGAIRPRALLANDHASQAGAPTPGDRQGAIRPVETPPDLDDEDEDAEQSKLLKLFSSSLPFQSSLARPFSKLLGLGKRAAPGSGTADLPVGRVERRSGTGGPNAKPALSAPVLGLSRPVMVPFDATYPEWDGLEGVYRPGWCHVVECEPPAARGDEAQLPGPGQTLLNGVARLARDLQSQSHQPDGDELDMVAAVERAVAIRAGRAAPDDLHRARQPRAPGLGVLVLVDVSDSTTDAPGGAKSVFDEERRVASDLVGALESVGHRVAAYGFNSEGREQVRLTHVKTFDEAFGAAAQQRLARLRPTGYTRMGAAIRHSLRILTTTSGVKQQMLVVISDGFPYDTGYQGVYAELDTRRALDEARDLSIAPVCLEFAPSSAESRLERVFGSAACLRLNRAAEFAPHLTPLFTTALRSTSLRNNQIRTANHGNRLSYATP